MTSIVGRTPPGPGLLRLVSALPGISSDPLAFLLKMLDEYGDCVLLNGHVRRYYVVRHPDAIRHVLQTNQKNYGKMTALDALMDEGLSVTEGTAWQQQRRRMQGAFDHSSLEAIAHVVTTVTAETLRRWECIGQSGDAINVGSEMARLAVDIVGRAMFGARLGEDADQLGRSLDALQRDLQRGFLFPRWLALWRARQFDRAVASIDEIVHRVIGNRNSGDSHGDLLSLLTSPGGSAGDVMTPRMIRDNVMVMLLGGYETTATALTWAWHLLARNPDVRNKLDEELRTILGGAPPQFEHIPQLSYTRMVVEETMRLFPPAWVIPRFVKDDDEVSGFRIRAGSTLLLAVFAAHRDERFWENSATFDPDRFSAQRSAGRPAHAYIPFGGGPRKCPGYAFAMLEMTLVLATVAQRFRLSLSDDGPVGMDPLLVLKPRGTLMAKLEPKKVPMRVAN